MQGREPVRRVSRASTIDGKNRARIDYDPCEVFRFHSLLRGEKKAVGPALANSGEREIESYPERLTTLTPHSSVLGQWGFFFGVQKTWHPATTYYIH